ncbi:MAG TPA: hypothetical protein VJX92_10890 [Methylomirabilota bacterium]|nr:hypothetical protein [Methylomirabilota bacterium]
MLGRRVVLALVLAVFYLGLVGAASLHSADFAWVPSYFDDDDGDFLPLLLAEQMQGLTVSPGWWVPALVLLVAVTMWVPSGRPQLAAARVRFRAPPRP